MKQDRRLWEEPDPAKIRRKVEKEIKQAIKDIDALRPDVEVGATVLLKNGGVAFQGIPMEYSDMVIEWRTWENLAICQRGVAKAHDYWAGGRNSFTDKRVVVPRPNFPNFEGAARPYQNEGVGVMMITEEGLVELPTGSGKTVLAMLLMAKLKQRALLVTTNTVVQGQTIKTARKFLGIEPGVIGEGIYQPKGDVVIATFQSLMNCVYKIRNQFGLVIFDEAHHLAADSLLTICAQIPAKYRFGMTATARRRDKKNEILQYILGPKMIAPSVLSMASYLSFPTIHFVFTSLEFPEAGWSGYLNELCNSRKRNRMIALLAIKSARKFDRILVLTRLKEHVTKLADTMLVVSKQLEEHRGLVFSRGVYELTGDTSKTIRHATLDSFKQYGGILVATEDLCGEGFDMPEIEALILASPASEIRGHQRVGRLMRLCEGDKQKAVFDFVDVGSIPERLHEIRENEYVSMGLTIGREFYA